MPARRRSPEEAFEYFLGQVAARGGRVTEPAWLGSRTPHRVICKEGHAVTAIPNSMQQGGGFCRTCIGQDPVASWGKFKGRVIDLGGTVVETDWLGADTPHRVICSGGHETRPLPSNVNKGQGLCRRCTQPTWNLAEQAFRDTVEQRGGRVLAADWRGVNKPHLIECANGHRHSIHPSRLRTFSGMCRTCAGQDTEVSKREFRERVNTQGGEVPDQPWRGTHHPQRIVCGAGHAVTVFPSTVRAGGGICKVCSGKDPETAYERFLTLVGALGGELLTPGWRNQDATYPVRCAGGHIFQCRPTVVFRGRGIGCRICAKQDSETARVAFRANVAAAGGCVLEEWKNSHRPYRVRCAAGHITRRWPSQLQAGGGICRVCEQGVWDIFYVVSNPAVSSVKFGITARGGRQRLARHRTDGYTQIIRSIENLPDAEDLERATLATLRLAELRPMRGREYFDLSALPVILDVVDHWSPSR